MTGRLAALHLGSTALNVGGARTCAERAALAVQILGSQNRGRRPIGKDMFSVSRGHRARGKERQRRRVIWLCLWHRKEVSAAMWKEGSY